MAARTAKVFRNGRNQAIRIPVELSFDTDTVTLEKRGDALIVRPKHRTGWDLFFSDESLVIQITGNTEKLDACVDMLRKFELQEIVRTGKILMRRGLQVT